MRNRENDGEVYVMSRRAKIETAIGFIIVCVALIFAIEFACQEQARQIAQETEVVEELL